MLTWHETERVQGVVEAVKAGRSPTVMAHGHVLTWLERFGPVDGRALGSAIDGLKIEAVAYAPVPYATPTEGFRKMRSALGNPVRAARRLKQRAALPSSSPLVYEVTFPGGERLLHLNCALHLGTEAAWLDEHGRRFSNADWTVVGVDFDEADAMRERIGTFDPQVLLVTDLVGDVRRRLGLPTQLLTPTVDALIDDGFDAHVFVSEASFRFE